MYAQRVYADIAQDEEGFLLNPADWDEKLAEEIALSENIALSEEHWLVIRFIRSYFEERQSVPENRTLLKYLKEALGDDIATRKYIHILFPYGYGQQACKIAGMIKPSKLMLDV